MSTLIPSWKRRRVRAWTGATHARLGPLLRHWAVVLCLLAIVGVAQAAGRKVDDPWSLKPVVRPAIPRGVVTSTNAIDAFLGASQRERGLQPAGLADRLTWLRRVSLDLTGLPPTVEEQDAFLADESSAAYERVTDRLLASEQHGVRYGRHWLDVLRYADLDENMPAAPGIHLWRDWVIQAVNQDLPYDEFARAQILGNRAAERRIISAAGHLTPVDPRPEDLFALGFLARGATSRADGDQQLAFSAVETISTAFLGMTVGCARCHDHFYDPITQVDYYSMKALFDPLALRPVELATAAEIFAHGRKVQDHETRLKRLVEEMRRFIEPHHSRLVEERLSMMPKDVQAAVRKPERERTAAERKLYDDYYPILRIDPPKLRAVMSKEEVERYDRYLKEINALKAPDPLPVFWSVAEDAKRAADPNYVLTTGDPDRPRKSQPVQPGFPFVRARPDFHQGRRETFVDWLTASDNPLFARVAVNRIWQWHFGSGLHGSADFGALGGQPIHPALLDWLASEFVAQKYSMKWLHRLIVTSETYRRASMVSRELDLANRRVDPENRMFWKFPLRRLEAEPIRDAMFQVAGRLDPVVGGPSYEGDKALPGTNRRAAYMSRGYRSFSEAMPAYLQTFDAEDGRAVCTRRTQTVTAPQALYLMNDELVQDLAASFGDRLRNEARGDLDAAVTLGFRLALGRGPTGDEQTQARGFLQADPARLRGLAWMLYNLDEFVYVR